jgi:hypothetical protein
VLLLINFAPYKGGNEKLRAIHDLDIEDKHTAILETEKVFDLKFQGAYDISNPQDHRLSIDGTTTKHYFLSDSPLAGLLLIETLRELVDLVNDILEAFTRMIEKRAMPLDAGKA